MTAQAGEGPVQTLVRVKEILGETERVISVKAECEDLQTTLLRFEQAGVTVSFAVLKGLVEQAVLRQENCALRSIRAECESV